MSRERDAKEEEASIQRGGKRKSCEERGCQEKETSMDMRCQCQVEKDNGFGNQLVMLHSYRLSHFGHPARPGSTDTFLVLNWDHESGHFIWERWRWETANLSNQKQVASRENSKQFKNCPNPGSCAAKDVAHFLPAMKPSC